MSVCVVTTQVKDLRNIVKKLFKKTSIPRTGIWFFKYVVYSLPFISFFFTHFIFLFVAVALNSFYNFIFSFNIRQENFRVTVLVEVVFSTGITITIITSISRETSSSYHFNNLCPISVSSSMEMFLQ